MAVINLLVITLSLLLLTTATTTATVTNQELEAALYTLRSRGYTLFPNAITTSDLRPLLLSFNATFTLFSPPDPLLFSLDLSSTATHYVNSLLRHVSPLRLPMSQLRSIGGVPFAFLDTLMPPHRLSIVNSFMIENGTVLDTVLLDGVRVSVPDLFLGSSISVHGLEGIILPPFETNSQAAARAFNSADRPVFSPAIPPRPSSERGTKKRVGNLGDHKGSDL